MLYGISNSDNVRLNNTPSSLHCDNRGNIKQELALRRNNLNQVKITNGENTTPNNNLNTSSEAKLVSGKNMNSTKGKAPLPRASRSRITSQSEQQNTSHPRNNYVVNLRRWAFSSFSSMTFNDLLVRIILTLLTGLLLSNSVLFYKLWILEEGLIENQGSRAHQDFYDTTKSRKVGTESDTPSYETAKDPNFHTVKTTSDWLQLLHRQEVAHQLELEKWHAILGAATELLRQTEQSLTNLQRSIHPLSLKNLGNLLRFQNSDWNSLIQNLQTFDTNSKDANQHIETNFKSDEHVNNQHIPSLNQPYENDRIEL